MTRIVSNVCMVFTLFVLFFDFNNNKVKVILIDFQTRMFSKILRTFRTFDYAIFFTFNLS